MEARTQTRAHGRFGHPCSALAWALVGAASPSCKPTTTEIDLGVTFPDDDASLSAVDNVSVVLAPNGASSTVSADGKDFALALELDPDGELRDLSLYLADGETLVAWGRTPIFSYATAADGLAVFAGYPGQLATFPGTLDGDTANLQGAFAPGRGAVLLAGDGATAFLDAYTLEIEAASTLDDPPEPDDGVMVGDALGGAQRIAFAQGLSISRFDPGEDAWAEIQLAGADLVGARGDAAWVVDGAGTVLTLFGGGDHTDVVAIDLVPPEDGALAARLVDDHTMDAPREGATAIWLVRDDTDEGEAVAVVGGDDPTRPLVWWPASATGLGPMSAWVEIGCVQADRGDASVVVRLVCGGGVRDGTPSADLIVVSVSPQGPTMAEVVEHRGSLPLAMAAPRWFRDDVAVYAQSDSSLVALGLADLEAREPLPALRASGGAEVAMPGGATLLVGGRDAMGTPTARIQVFTPTPAR